MTRILKVRNLLSPRTPRDVSATSANAGTARWSGSYHDAAEKTRRTTSKRSIRRLMVRDPMNDPLSRPEVEQFTNNPNPKFDPSKAPGNVSPKKQPRAVAAGGSRTHQKVFRPNRQTLFGGKTLKKRR